MLAHISKLIVLLFIIGGMSSPNQLEAFPVTSSGGSQWYTDDGSCEAGWSEPILRGSSDQFDLVFMNTPSYERGVYVWAQDILPPHGCPEGDIKIILTNGKMIKLTKEGGRCSWTYVASPSEKHNLYEAFSRDARPDFVEAGRAQEKIDKTNWDNSWAAFKKITDPKTHPDLYGQRKYSDDSWVPSVL